MFKHILFALVLALGIGNAVLAAEPVDINTATAEQLAEALNGVGHIDDLINVRGIGMATVDKNREMMRVEQSDSDQ